MSAIAIRPTSLLDAARDLWREMRRDAPGHALMGAALLALAVPTAALFALDARAIDGVNIWTKPLKFQVSLGVFSLTLAFVARWAGRQVVAWRWWKPFTAAVLVSIALEMVWLMSSAALGERAHFNQTHSILAPTYFVMGLLATILTAATAQYAFAIHRNVATGLTPAVKAGLVWGLGLTLPLTLLTAFALSVGAGHHFTGDGLGVGGSDANGAFPFGWSREGGDGRVPHFLGTHAMHAVPLAALAFSVLGWRGAWAGRLAALGWTAMTLAAFALTLAGYSLVF